MNPPSNVLCERIHLITTIIRNNNNQLFQNFGPKKIQRIISRNFPIRVVFVDGSTKNVYAVIHLRLVDYIKINKPENPSLSNEIAH